MVHFLVLNAHSHKRPRTKNAAFLKCMNRFVRRIVKKLNTPKIFRVCVYVCVRKREREREKGETKEARLNKVDQGKRSRA